MYFGTGPLGLQLLDVTQFDIIHKKGPVCRKDNIRFNTTKDNRSYLQVNN